jgi:hypothetical protein
MHRLHWSLLMSIDPHWGKPMPEAHVLLEHKRCPKLKDHEKTWELR